MKVVVANRAYEMPVKKYEELRKVASEQVPFGIYAVEKPAQNYAELRCDHATSMTHLKEMIRSYRRKGWRVCANGR